ncbi:MAG: phage scaffolding protein [Clostridiales bacterium]|nr:phage scaffolding protein [Clostridiales bacterium]
MKEKLLKLGLSEADAQKAAELFEAQTGSEGDGNLRLEAERLKERIADYEEEIKRLNLQNAVDGALMAAGAKNVRAVRALIDFEELKPLKNGEIEGLAEQIEALSSGDDTGFLFEKKSGKKGLKGMKPAYSGGKSGGKDFKDFNYDDWDKYFKNKG